MANLDLNRFIRNQEPTKTTSTKTTSTKTTTSKPSRSGIQSAPEPVSSPKQKQPAPKIAPPPVPKVQKQVEPKPTRFEQRLQDLSRQAETFVNTLRPSVTPGGRTAAEFFGQSPEAARALRPFEPAEPEGPGSFERFINFLTPGVTTSGQTAAEFFGESPEAARALGPIPPSGQEFRLDRRREQIRERFGQARDQTAPTQTVDDDFVREQARGHRMRLNFEQTGNVLLRERDLINAARNDALGIYFGEFPNVISEEVQFIIGYTDEQMLRMGYAWDGNQWRIADEIGPGGGGTGPGGGIGPGGGRRPGGGQFPGPIRFPGASGARAARAVGLTMWSI